MRMIQNEFLNSNSADGPSFHPNLAIAAVQHWRVGVHWRVAKEENREWTAVHATEKQFVSLDCWRTLSHLNFFRSDDCIVE